MLHTKEPIKSALKKGASKKQRRVSMQDEEVEEPQMVEEKATEEAHTEEQNTESYNLVRKIIFEQAMQDFREKNERSAVHFNDVVDHDRNDMVETRITHGITDLLVESDIFRIFMLFIILLDCVVIGLQTDDSIVVKAKLRFGYDVLQATRYVFFNFYVWEVVVKMLFNFVKFTSSGWNILDLILIVCEFFRAEHSVLNLIGCIRVLRVLRPFKLSKYTSAFGGAQIMVHTVIRSVPDMTNIAVLVLLIMFMWAVVGTVVFGKDAPSEFGGLGNSYFSLFVAVTQIGWMQDFYVLEKGGYFTSAAIYYCLFLYIGVFIVAKVIMAVLVSNLEERYRQIEEEKRRRNNRLQTKRQLQMGVFAQKLVNPPKKLDPIWKHQIPYELPNFDNISCDKIERYFEGNLAEYLKLKEQLKNILKEKSDRA
ncbi:Ion transport protein-domain-containing protein [Gorgonomyces haynaldii]|nr:Ion transport protein-domain-containing protein [Gorgonomyces haynaldii]